MLRSKSWIDEQVEDVDSEVDDDEADRDHDDNTLNYCGVTVGDAVDHELTHSGKTEDLLDDHSATEEVSDP